jgi:surface protein
MFCQVGEFNEPLEKWQIGQVTNMSGMFNQALQFN